MRPPLENHQTQHQSRRGITLIEMLVALGLLVLMMLILVNVFQAATGSITTQRTYAEIDRELRRLDTIIRQDLGGVTAKMTPPNDPKLNRGYFEYAENVAADPQGEDTDDTLRFTARAPAGRPFVGRVWVPLSPSNAQGTIQNALQPITVSSDSAEIIYFLRNGNLYRRILLILPDRAGNLGVGSFLNNAPPQNLAFVTSMFTPVSAFPTALVAAGLPMTGFMGMNDMSVRPRKIDASVFSGLFTYSPTPNTLGDLTDRHHRTFNPTWADDYVNNSTGALGPDGLPDDTNQDGVPDYVPTLYLSGGGLNAGYINEQPVAQRQVANLDVFGFPYIFPGSFSAPDSTSGALGWLHGMPVTAGVVNHAPLDTGDSLAIPDGTQASQLQTWWGFPTWRETASPNWLAPFKRLNDPAGASYFSSLPGTGVSGIEAPYHQAPGLSWVAPQYLPPQPTQLFTEDPNNFPLPASYFFMPPGAVYEDDLLATNVRSFDVKAYDPTAYFFLDANGNSLPPGYYDLGYYSASLANNTPPAALGTFGHEGRMPPLSTDYRMDPQFGTPIGDDHTGVRRLRRVWDSWSTTYTSVPALPANPMNGPLMGLPPVYPSYPAPYPAPLRGIQIQLRVSDGNNQRIKTLTIHVDFNDKL